MIKETVICIIIVIGIIGLELLTQNFTEKTVKEIREAFSKIENEIVKQNIEQIKVELENISNKWEEKQKRLAYYIEHDELEKVHTAIVTMKSYIKTNDFSSAMAELEEGKFVIEHIKENIGKADYIFVSTHSAVIAALINANIDFTLVFPERSLKAEWVGRCFLRGSDTAFCRSIATMWDIWQRELEETVANNNLKCCRLKHGEYLSYVLENI